MAGMDPTRRLFGQAPFTAIPNDQRAQIVPQLPLPQSADSEFLFALDTLTATLLRSINKRANFHMQAFSATVDGRLELPAQNRWYLLIQNTHPSAKFQIGIGYVPNDATGLLLNPGGYYEPPVIPQNEIYIRRVPGGAVSTGIIIYATELTD